MPESAFSYATLGVVLGHVMGDFRTARQYSELAVKLSEKVGDKIQICKTSQVVGGLIGPWVRHLPSLEEILVTGYEAGLESGEFQFAGYCFGNHIQNLFSQGKSIEQHKNDVLFCLSFFHRLSNQLAFDMIMFHLLIDLNLSGLTENTVDFRNEMYSEHELIEICETGDDALSLFTYYTYKSFVLYLYQEYHDSLQYAERAIPYKTGATGLICQADHAFYHSLGLTALPQHAAGDSQIRLNEYQQRLKTWADICPENFQHKHLLVKAEIARTNGEDLEAMDLYDQSIASAHEYGFTQNEALANELAAKFWLTKGNAKIAATYLRDAHYGYQLWGAKRKVHHLEGQYPQLLKDSIRLKAFASDETGSTDTTPSTMLDANTLVKATRAISAEIRLDELLKSMLQLMMENAGAQTGMFVLKHDTGAVIEATGIADNNEITVQPIPLQEVSNDRQPASLIRYVIRTGKELVLNNAVRTGSFMQDAYIRAHQTNSVLCAPIQYQQKLLGVVYLENNLTSGAFTPDRLEVVNVLAAQAAISIENARLYATLEDKVAARTQELQQALTDLKTAQSHLVQSEKMAGLGTMVAGVTHEINNPVTFSYTGALNANDQLAELKQFIFKLAGDDFSDKLRMAFEERFDKIFRNISAIVDGTQRIKTIVNDLRTFSRLDEEEQKQANIVDGLKSTINLVRANYQERIEFITDFQVDPEIWCYPAQLNQVFLNIITNACQAIVDKQDADDEAPGKLTLETRQEGEYIAIHIQDTGVGIARDIRPHIFDPFFTTKAVGQGVGLGLSISYEIVRKHDGSIMVESEPGAGSCFTVLLPLRK
jgi:signal transduction histidine kinase